MAGVTGWFKEVFKITLPAARDLSSYQYHAVKVDSNTRIDYIDTSSSPAGFQGILQNTPDATGEEAEVMCVGVSLYVAGGTLSIADKLGSNNAYRGAAVTADKAVYFAFALQAAAAAGEQISVFLPGGYYYIST